MAWIQFICNTTSDKADALSDAFSECGAVAVTFEDDADQPIYEPDLGTTPLWTATRIVALFDAETNPDDVDNMLSTLITDPPSYRVEAVEDKDWEREWMDNFHPIQFGERLWICPSWHTPPAPDAVNIMLDPGLAFGTGTHPTTALCLNWLDQAELKGKYVIDYGCGSGILAIAAALLGAERVIGDALPIWSIPILRRLKRHVPMRREMASKSKPIYPAIVRMNRVIYCWPTFLLVHCKPWHHCLLTSPSPIQSLSYQASYKYKQRKYLKAIKPGLICSQQLSKKIGFD